MSYLITLAEYKAFMGLDTSDTAHDTQLNALIAAVADEFDRYLGFGIIRANHNDVMNGTGNNFLRLKNIPIFSITSIIIDYNSPSATTFGSDDFISNPANGLVYFNPNSTTSGLPGYFPCGNLNILASYAAGWEQADVPQQLKRAAANMIYRIQNSLSPSAIADIKLDQYAQKSNVVDINQALFDDVRRILDRYKVVRFIF